MTERDQIGPCTIWVAFCRTSMLLGLLSALVSRLARNTELTPLRRCYTIRTDTQHDRDGSPDVTREYQWRETEGLRGISENTRVNRPAAADAITEAVLLCRRTSIVVLAEVGTTVD